MAQNQIEIIPNELHSMDMEQLITQQSEEVYPSPNEVLDVTITKINDKELLVDTGGKSEGIVYDYNPSHPYFRENEFKVGDSISACLVYPETRKGYSLLSFLRALREKRWVKLEEAQSQDDAVNVKVIRTNRGGLIVSYQGSTQGFIPLSQIGRDRINFSRRKRDREDNPLDDLIGSSLQAKIIEVDPSQNRLILSERATEYDREEIKKKLVVGAVLEGTVSNVLGYGIFVDLGGFDGFVHISEISWKRIDDIHALYKVNDKVKVKIIGIEDEGKRVSLSIKALSPSPWLEFADKYKIGEVVTAKVTSIVPYGAFVQVEKGFDGLLHVSEFPDDFKGDIGKILQEEQEVEVRIISMDVERQRLGLSMRQVESPTEDFDEKEKAKKINLQEAIEEETSLENEVTDKKREEEKEETKEEEKSPEVEGDEKEETLAKEDREGMLSQLQKIEGIGPALSKRLYEKGFDSLESLREANISELTLIPGFRKSLAEKVIKSAKSVLGDE